MSLVDTAGDIMRNVGVLRSISGTPRPKPLFVPRTVRHRRLWS